MTTVTCPKCSTSFAVALEGRGVLPIGPHQGKVETFAAPHRALPAGAVSTFGAPVEIFAEGAKSDGSVDASEGVWMTLAYAVSMKGSEVTLSKEDFEAAVANHRRYPCSPLVIEHADTDWWMSEPEWAEPHGHVEELRVGEAEVTEMDGAKRVAATLEGRVTFLDDTRAAVKARKWRFVSITLVKGVTDEATGAALGALLWSLSLTAHPRLTGLAPIPASLRARVDAMPPDARAELLAALGAPPPAPPAPPALPPSPPAPALPTPTPETTTMKFSPLLAALGLAAAASEEDAEKKLTAFAHLGADALKSLGLPVTASAADVAARIKALTDSTARAAALDVEVTRFRAAEATRLKADREGYLADLLTARPELELVRSSLARHAEGDWEDFQRAYPRPSREELATAAAEKVERGQDAERTAPVAVTAATNPRTRDVPTGTSSPKTTSALAMEIQAVYAEFGEEVPVVDCIQDVEEGDTPASVRARLGRLASRARA